MKIILRQSCREHYKFLYQLLQQRRPQDCISHKSMPSYEEHCLYNDKKPYKEDFVIIHEGVLVGRFYITKLGEVGIHLLGGSDPKIKEYLLTQHKHRIKFANVSAQNKEYEKILKNAGFRLIQHTYENLL